ncbi:hypothetical protein EON65_05330 [archaeon]|nr:MAG: hypothetical protein EON65_05330 [archaeon]
MGGGASKQIAYGSHEGSSSAATTAPVSNQSVIRLINFELFKTLGSLPHYPEKRKLCSNIEKIDTKNSLFVFISYCWQRSWPGSEGYINHPHPDTTNDDIYKLCVEGIEKVKNSLAPGMKHCYVWVDYGCLDLEKPHYSSPSSLSSSTPPMPPSSPLPLPWSSEVVATMDRVMRASDLLFTPVFDAENRGLLGSSFQDIYTEYLAPGWKAEKV